MVEAHEESGLGFISQQFPSQTLSDSVLLKVSLTHSWTSAGGPKPHKAKSDKWPQNSGSLVPTGRGSAYVTSTKRADQI